MEKQASNEPFVIECVYDAPVIKVWQAITDNDKIRQWYFELKEFKAEVGFEFEFTGGSEQKKYLHKCRITCVEPQKVLAYTWCYAGYPGNSEVTWELSDENGKTRLKLTHSGLHTFTANNPDFARTTFEQGWTYITGTGLKNYVEQE